jgi:hypothetical protein
MTGKSWFWIACLLLLNACGGGGGVHPPPPPSITLTSLVPNYAVAGSGNTSVFVNGSGFTASSVVQWNGNPLPTTFGTNQILSASIGNSLIAQPGAAQIAVKDGSAISNALTFGVASPAAATAGVVSMITVAPDGTPANGDSPVDYIGISSTGRYVSFQSNATNLVSGPASTHYETYERDTCIGAPTGCVPNTIRVTATYDGSAANGHSYDSNLSGNGRYVIFESGATNILPNSNDCSAGIACVFLRDTCVGVPSGCVPSTTAISVDMSGNIVRAGGTAITPDGRFVVFGSVAANVALGETSGIGDEYIRDTCIGAPPGCAPSTVLISSSYNGAARDGYSGPSAVSSGGQYVAFQSWATDITSSEKASVLPGIFWRNTCIGASSCTPITVQADVTANGSQPNSGAFSAAPGITADGRLAAFASGATNLVSTNVNGIGNVYVRDTCTGVSGGCAPTTTLASLANDGSVGNCGSPSQGLGMSADGRFVAFDSIATNLTPDDNFLACSYEDVFVRDTCYGVASGCTPSTVRVSVTNSPNPQTPGNSISGLPAISGDGHYIVFLSAATNLVPGVTGNGHTMVYLARTGF